MGKFRYELLNPTEQAWAKLQHTPAYHRWWIYQQLKTQQVASQARSPKKPNK